MKDIKSYVIGFLTCTCMFLIMGQTDGEKEDWYVEDIAEMEMNVSGGTIKIGNEYGRYQGFADNNDLYLVDTTTGQLFYEKKQRGEKIWQQMIKPNNRYGDPIRP